MNKIEVKNLGHDQAEVLLYGDIGGWGVTAAAVKAQLDGISASKITLRVHSYGGDATEGIAIKNILKNHQAHITAVVDGVAASAASLIAVAGADELVMSENSELMIHKGWVWPNASEADDLRKLADRLDKINLNYASAYAAKAGGDPAEWLELMAAETWFSAEEAVQIGLADRVLDEAAPVAASLSTGSLVFAKLKYSGRRASPAPALKHAPLGQEGKNMDFMASIAQRLGIEDKADEATVLAALDEALAEQAGEPAGEVAVKIVPDMSDFSKDVIQKMLAEVAGNGGSYALAEAEEKLAAARESGDTSKIAEVEEKLAEARDEKESAEAPDVSDLTVPVDKERLNELLEAETKLKALQAKEADREAESIVTEAVRAGKIGAAAQDRWVAAYKADPEDAAARLQQIPAGLINRMEVGHVHEPDDGGVDDDKFSHLRNSVGY